VLNIFEPHRKSRFAVRFGWAAAAAVRGAVAVRKNSLQCGNGPPSVARKIMIRGDPYLFGDASGLRLGCSLKNYLRCGLKMFNTGTYAPASTHFVRRGRMCSKLPLRESHQRRSIS
jgi:hypothetical protein